MTDDDPELTEAQRNAVAKRITSVGRALAATLMEEAADSPDIALAMLGVAAGQIISKIDKTRRTEVLRAYLESFADTPDAAG